jgi:hypothetical protein
MKPHRLLSTPIPHSDESPASILIRAAEGNRYENVHQVVAVTKLNVNHSNLDLLVNYIDKFLRLIAALCLKCIAPEEVLERRGPTMRSLRRFLYHFFPVNFFRQDGTAFCPACLHDKPYLRKIWMFRPYANCHIHGLPIQTRCPHCKAEMKISRGAICLCSQCKCKISQELTLATPDTVSTWVKHFVSEPNQETEEFTQIFTWAKSIAGVDGTLKDDGAAAVLTYQYFNNQEDFPKNLLDFMSHDSRHPKLKLLPLLASDGKLRKIAADILNTQFLNAPFSGTDLDYRLSLTEIRPFLGVSTKTVANLLKRNSYRPDERETTISVSELFTIIEIDRVRKEDIKEHKMDHLLTVTDVAKELQVHTEIIRSVQKAGYLPFQKQIVAGSLKYTLTKEQLDVFCSEYMLVGTLGKKLGVNSTDLTAKLAALGIKPAISPKDSQLKTCVFRYQAVCDLTADDISNIGKCPTNAGRKPKGIVVEETPINDQHLSIIEVGGRLDVSIQQVKTLIQRNVIERVLDPRPGVYVTRKSVEDLIGYLENPDYITLENGASDLKINKIVLKREWISAEMIEHKDLVYWELVKATDIQKVKDIKSEYVNASEASEILGMHRTHANNLYKRGILNRHYFDKGNKIPLYKRADILLLKSA